MRHRSGSVVQDKRSKVYNFFWWENGKRRSKALGKFPTKAAARGAAKPLRDALESKTKVLPGKVNVHALVESYRVEKMPRRAMTRQGYNTWLTHYVIPKWGDSSITELQAYPVDLWLQSLNLSAKSKVHIRGMISILWEYSMWRGDLPVQRNPMELVLIRGASRRTRHIRKTLTADQFQQLLSYLTEPFRTMALVCMCFGLRISECLALRWSDVDWLNGTLKVERGIVHQVVDEVKTQESEQTMHIESEMIEVLKQWRQQTEFSSADNWIFASPVQIGRLPYSYNGVWHALSKAAVKAGMGALGTHTFRHTYRTWLDSQGTPVGVQQKLMRHSDIRMTMNHYGTAETADMREARGKIARLALRQV